MKIKYAIIAATILAAATVISVKSFTKSTTLFEANVEALAQDEGGALIICSMGSCGQCFDIKTAWPYYRCIWTGYQSDNCDCDKVGWIGV